MDVYETVIDSPLSYLQWGDGDYNSLVFCVTVANTVYRSDDDGVSWVSLSSNSSLMGLAPTEVATVSAIIDVPGNFAHFYLLGADGRQLWKTTDAGKSFAYTTTFDNGFNFFKI